MCTLKVLLVALWCLSVSVKSYAVYSGSCGESVNWSLDTQTGLLEITGSGEMEDNPWKSHKSSIIKCTIENGVTSIRFCAFDGCTWLTSITIPESVTSIGDWAFSRCTGLTSITIPESVTSIGNYAFYGCTGLTNITIPESVTSIGSSAFDGCTGLTSITWNAISYTSFGSSTFDGIKENITSFTFGDKVQTIPANLCSEMSNLTNITIPNSVTSIGDEAFEDCTGLTSITIPESVTSIGSSAFNGTPWLNNQSDGLIYIGKVCYDYKGEMPENTTIIIKEGTTRIGDEAFYECTGLTSITIPNSVTSIGVRAFYGCTGLTSITIPNSVTYIEIYAFYGCTGLTSITIPESVTSIGDGAFYKCTGLTSITIGNSVTSIGDYAFFECSGLTGVIMGKEVTSIGTSAFANNSNLVSVTCYSQTSPEAVLTGNRRGSFYGISKEAILYYPKGSDYSAWAPYFAQMIEMDETDIDTPKADDGKDTTYDIYDMSGRTVRKAATTTDGLKAGLYIINGRKVLVE